jgi:hypothetical protein
MAGLAWGAWATTPAYRVSSQGHDAEAGDGRNAFAYDCHAVRRMESGQLGALDDPRLAEFDFANLAARAREQLAAVEEQRVRAAATALTA